MPTSKLDWLLWQELSAMRRSFQLMIQMSSVAAHEDDAEYKAGVEQTARVIMRAAFRLADDSGVKRSFRAVWTSADDLKWLRRVSKALR